MNEDIKNDLLELLLWKTTHIFRPEPKLGTDEQYQRECEIAERWRDVALAGYIATGKRLFTNEPES